MIDEESGTLLTHYPKNQVWGSSIAVGPEGQVYVAWIETDENPDGTLLNPSFPSMKLTATFKVCRSDDGGITFHPNVDVASFPMVSNPLDPPGWNLNLLTQANLGVDTSTGDYKGRVYAVWHQALINSDLGGFLPSIIMMSFSDDNGKTWSKPKNISPIANNTAITSFFPSIAVSRNTGHLAVAYYTNACNVSSNPKLLNVMATREPLNQPVSGGKNLEAVRLTKTDLDPRVHHSLRFAPDQENWLGDYISTAFMPPLDLIAVWTDGRQAGASDTDIFTNKL